MAWNGTSPRLRGVGGFERTRIGVEWKTVKLIVRMLWWLLGNPVSTHLHISKFLHVRPSLIFLGKSFFLPFDSSLLFLVHPFRSIQSRSIPRSITLIDPSLHINPPPFLSIGNRAQPFFWQLCSFFSFFVFKIPHANCRYLNFNYSKVAWRSAWKLLQDQDEEKSKEVKV